MWINNNTLPLLLVYRPHNSWSLQLSQVLSLHRNQITRYNAAPAWTSPVSKTRLKTSRPRTRLWGLSWVRRSKLLRWWSPASRDTRKWSRTWRRGFRTNRKSKPNMPISSTSSKWTPTARTSRRTRNYWTRSQCSPTSCKRWSQQLLPCNPSCRSRQKRTRLWRRRRRKWFGNWNDVNRWSRRLAPRMSSWKRRCRNWLKK